MYLKFFTKKKGMMLTAAVPEFRRWKQDDQRFKASLAHSKFSANLDYVITCIRKGKL